MENDEANNSLHLNGLTLNGKSITKEQLEEKKEQLKNDKNTILSEVGQNTYKTKLND